MLYNKADVFIICFSLIDRKTFQHVEQVFHCNKFNKFRVYYEIVAVTRVKCLYFKIDSPQGSSIRYFRYSPFHITAYLSFG